MSALCRRNRRQKASKGGSFRVNMAGTSAENSAGMFSPKAEVTGSNPVGCANSFQILSGIYRCSLIRGRREHPCPHPCSARNELEAALRNTRARAPPSCLNSDRKKPRQNKVKAMQTPISISKIPRILREQYGVEVTYRRIYNLVLDGRIPSREGTRWHIGTVHKLLQRIDQA